MSTISHTDQLTLDLSAAPGKRSDVTLFAKQDDNTRRVRIILHENGEEYQIPDGVSILMRALKPDGHFVLADSPFEGCNVYLTFPREMLTCAGCVRAEICLLYGDEILTSANFYIEVLPHALSDSESKSELSAITKALDAAAFLTKQALIPLPVETISFNDGYSLPTASIRFHGTEPTWENNEFTFADGGTVYSDVNSAYSKNAIYFFDSDDHTAYCKLIGSGSVCTGFTRYRPLVSSGGMTQEMRDLLDGKSVEGRALPTEYDASLLHQLINNRRITLQSKSYHLIETSLLTVITAWADIFINKLVYGESFDLGDGVRRRFVTEDELETIQRRLSALEKA